MPDELARTIVEIKRDEAFEIVTRQAEAGDDPNGIVEECRRGHEHAADAGGVRLVATRRALQERSGDLKYIETVPKRGYRLIGRVRPIGQRRISWAVGIAPRTWHLFRSAASVTNFRAGSSFPVRRCSQPCGRPCWKRFREPAL